MTDPTPTPPNETPPTVTITLTAEDLKQAYWLVQTKATFTPGAFCACSSWRCSP